MRRLGHVVVAFLALSMAAGAAAFLLLAIANRFSHTQNLRVTVFDGVGTVGGVPARLRAMVHDVDTGQALPGMYLVFRYADGYTVQNWAYAGGIISVPGRGGLGEGVHPVTAGLPETHPRLDVCGSGAVWVRPADEPVVWFDASALVPAPSAIREEGAWPPPAMMPLVDAMKTLASGRQAVYLVAAEAGRYAFIRRRLRTLRGPPGPAFWIAPGDERSRLAGLLGVWPRVEGAVLAEPGLVQVATKCSLKVYRVPAVRADGGAVDAWRDVLDRWHAPATGGRSPGERM